MIDPSIYNINLPWMAWAALGLMVALMAVIAMIMWPKLVRTARRVKADDEASMPTGGYPSVSVVVYAKADGENLRTLLPQILEQDYPAQMEVIVVNDASIDNTETIVSELELRYSNLYMTFTPDQSRSLSRRKLSLTLGIKAARYDVVLLTCGNCRVESNQWMRAMMRHIVAGKEVVLGYAEPWGDDEPDNDRRKRRRAFDTLWQSVRWISSAICGHPIMGTGYNLAYLRRLFFQHKGFSQTLHLTYGDDDLFVNEIATGRNTAVELSHAARIVSMEHSPAELHDNYRMRRDFTASMLPRRSFLTMGLTSWLWWLWPLAGVAAGWLAWPSAVGAASAVAIAVIFMLLHAMLWRRCSRALGLRPLFWTVPFMAWTRWMRTLRHKLRGQSSHKSYYTRVQ